MLRRTFGPKREEVAGGRRSLHHEGLHNLYASTNIISMVKSKKMEWARHVVCVGEMRNVYVILVGRPEGKRPLGKPMRRWEYNIRMDLRNTMWKVRARCIWLGLRTTDGCCEHRNEQWLSTKDREFLQQLSYYQNLKMDSALWS
jgi:hypothetical protein